MQKEVDSLCIEKEKNVLQTNDMRVTLFNLKYPIMSDPVGISISQDLITLLLFVLGKGTRTNRKKANNLFVAEADR